MTEKRRKILGILLASFSIFVWGITFVSTKYLLSDFSSLEILTFRFFTAYIGLWIIHPKFVKIQFADNILFVLAALSGVELYQLFENIAIHFTNASNVSVIVGISPLFTAILSQAFLKERHLSLWFIIGFVISIVGIALVCFNGSVSLSFNPKGDILALSAAVCWSFYSFLVSLINRKLYDPICATRRLFFFAILIMIPLSLMGWGLETHCENASDFVCSLYFSFDKSVNAERFSKIWNIVNLLFLGIFASGICFTTWNKACQITGTVKISCMIYLIPVVTIFFAFFFLGEKITLQGGIGSAVTIAGLFVSEIRSSK